MDLTASILAATATPVPSDLRLDGIDLLPVLTGESPVIERTLFWRIQTPARQQRAVRRGDWKALIDGDDVLIYNLREDIGERHDLAARRPDIAAALRPLILAWEKEVDAERKSKP
jgi:arylsulfatase A